VPSYFLGTGIPSEGDGRQTALCSSAIHCHVKTNGWLIFCISSCLHYGLLIRRLFYVSIWLWNEKQTRFFHPDEFRNLVPYHWKSASQTLSHRRVENLSWCSICQKAVCPVTVDTCICFVCAQKEFPLNGKCSRHSGCSPHPQTCRTYQAQAKT